MFLPRAFLLSLSLVAGVAGANQILDLSPVHDFGVVSEGMSHAIPGAVFRDGKTERLTFSLAHATELRLRVDWYNITVFDADPVRSLDGAPSAFQLFDAEGTLIGTGKRNTATLASCFSNDPSVCNTYAWSYMRPFLDAGSYSMVLSAELKELDQFPPFAYTVYVTPVPVPEPGTVALWGIGLAALSFVKRRRAAGLTTCA